MIRVVQSGRFAGGAEAARLGRAEALYRALRSAPWRLSARSVALLAAVDADPRAVRVAWLSPVQSRAFGDHGPSLPPVVEGGDPDTGAVVTVLAAIVGSGPGVVDVLSVISSILGALGLPPVVGSQLLPGVEEVLASLRTGTVPTGAHLPEQVHSTVVAAWAKAATDELPDDLESGVGMVLAGAAALDDFVLPHAGGMVVPIRVLPEADQTAVQPLAIASGDSADMLGSVFVEWGVDGWWRVEEGVVTRELSPTAMLEARISAWRSSGGGRPLLQLLGAERHGPLGRAVVEPLPTAAGDGVIVHQIDEDGNGTLSHRVDVVRTIGGVDVVASASGVAPLWLEEASIELLLLCCALEPVVGPTRM